MERIEEDIKNAIEISKCCSDYGEDMKEYSRIYQNTSENIKQYMLFLEGNYKNALLPTASGDHELEAILNGITNITCFDINRLARYFTELKFGAIKSLKKDDYINFMYEDMLNQEIFSYFKSSLDDDIRIFWDEVYDKCNIDYVRFNLFRKMGIYNKDGNIIKSLEFSKYCVDNFTRYLEENNYRLVQERLQKAKITYIESDLLDLPKVLQDNYDLINLTNIYEYINNEIFNGGDEKFSSSVKGLINHLNDNGKMLITYLYRCSLKDIKKYKSKSLFYAKALLMLQLSPLSLSYYNLRANEHGRKNIMDKLYTFRKTQFLKYLKDIDIDFYELDEVGLGCSYGDPSDMALIYTKRHK